MIYIGGGKKRNSGRRTKDKSGINIGILILILLIMIFFVRVIGVLKNNKERGAFAYVQLLNLGMPVVESQVYDESSYVENKLSLSSVFFEALGLDNLTYKGIIQSELSFLDVFNIDNDSNKQSSNNIFTFDPFQVSEDSISKVSKDVDDSTNTQIYNPSLKKELNTSKPEVLIYHTHTNENYNADYPDSLNEDTNVVGAGDVLEAELRDNYGISVIHDKTDHCYSYNDSYVRSGETVDKYLNQYGDFKLIIDLHRDSVDNKAATTTDIYGRSAAKIMFVNAKNSTRYEKNKELTEKIFNKTSELFPSLPRKILTYNRGKSAFNQSKSDACVLFEIGSHTNTPEEAKVTAQCMARVIAEVLSRN